MKTDARTFAMRPDKTVDIELNDHSNSPRIYWSRTGNSYVMVAAASRDSYRVWQTAEGVPVHLYSINGIGEIRWSVDTKFEGTTGDHDAASYFGLTPLAS